MNKDIFLKRNINLFLQWAAELLFIFWPLILIGKIPQSPFQVTAQVNDTWNLILIAVGALMIINYLFNFYKAWKINEHKKVLLDILRAGFLVYEILLGVILANVMLSMQFNHLAAQIFLCGSITFVLIEVTRLKREFNL